MGRASLSMAGEGRAVLSGVLDFSSVPRIWPELEHMIRQEPQLRLSLAKVDSSNSAGLALMLEAKQSAAADSHELTFQDVPPSLVDLAQLSNLTGVLGLVDESTS